MKVVLDHVALVVGLLDDALRIVADLGLPVQPVQSFPSEGTRECYVGGPRQPGRILLVEPVSDGPYTDALARRGVGLHHVALAVENLDRFVAEVVDGSGWLVHPRSLTPGAGDTIWLARPGVEALVELTAGVDGGAMEHLIERVVVAGLDRRAGLERIFADLGIPVVAGARSGVVVAGQFLAAPEWAAPPVIDDPFAHNRAAWDRKVEQADRWTVPFDAAQIERARRGDLDLLLTPTTSVPREWFGKLEGADVLCLASGGGQQAPMLAAAGANVTVFDASDKQLGQDRVVAQREGLELRTVQGDMRDLAVLADRSFDLVFHPCSNSFVAEIEPVWREAYRVLRPGGHLVSGFGNPVMYCFDWDSVDRGDARLRYELPYSDLENLENPWVARSIAAGGPVEFGHTLTRQIGGQIAAGFAIVGFYEDNWDSDTFPNPWFDGFIATRALKPS